MKKKLIVIGDETMKREKPTAKENWSERKKKSEENNYRKRETGLGISYRKKNQIIMKARHSLKNQNRTKNAIGFRLTKS